MSNAGNGKQKMNGDFFVNGKKVIRDNVFLALLQLDRPSVFESFKSYQGKIFRAKEHLDRLFDSAQTSGLHVPKSRAVLMRELDECLKDHRSEDKFLRLTVDERDSFIFVTERTRPPEAYDLGVDLITSITRRCSVRSSPPEVKSRSFFNNVLAVIDTANPDGKEILFLDADGYVVEGLAWNLFAVKNGRLLTPQTGFLIGVTRQFVIECACLEHLPVLESNLTRHDFWSADEAFLTNTSSEIVPVRSLDSRQVGIERPGPITRQLRLRFKRQVAKELNLR